MKFQDFIISLLPNFERADLLEDLGLMRVELNELTIPPYENSVPVFAKWDFKSPRMSAFSKAFDNNVRSEFKGNFILVTFECLKRAEANIAILERLVEKQFAKDVTAGGMTYLKGNIVQYMESISFAMKYARRILLLSHAAETNVFEDKNTGKELTPAEFDWLAANQNAYFMVLSVISGKTHEVERVLGNVPDILINVNTADMVSSTIGNSKLDPFHFGLIPIKMNPIYHIRMAIAEWQVARYNAGVEEKRALEYRLLNLKSLKDGKPDAALQEQIEYSEGRLAKLNYKLQKMEEDYA